MVHDVGSHYGIVRWWRERKKEGTRQTEQKRSLTGPLFHYSIIPTFYLAVQCFVVCSLTLFVACAVVHFDYHIHPSIHLSMLYLVTSIHFHNNNIYFVSVVATGPCMCCVSRIIGKNADESLTERRVPCNHQLYC